MNTFNNYKNYKYIQNYNYIYNHEILAYPNDELLIDLVGGNIFNFNIGICYANDNKAATELSKLCILESEDSEMKCTVDKVNHPSHYTWLKEICGIEVIDITRHMDFDLGNAIKYILRCGHKSEKGYTDKEKTIEDLKKARWYIDDKIKMLDDECKVNS